MVTNWSQTANADTQVSIVTHATDFEFDGPWLLDSKSLLQLDDIIDEHWKELEAHETNRLDHEVEGRLEHYEHCANEQKAELREEFRKAESERLDWKRQRELTIELGNKKTATAQTFRQLLDEPNLRQESANGFTLKIQRGDVSCNVSVPSRWNQKLVVSVEPQGVHESKQLALALERWALEHQAPLWQQLWRSISVGLVWYVGLAIILVVSWFILVSNTSRAHLRESARQLIEDGLTDDETAEGVELLLRSELLRETQAASPLQVPWWYRVLVWLGIPAMIIASIRPNVVLGIGRGATHIRNWRRWLKFVGVTIPGLILGSFLIPFLLQLVNQFLGPGT